MNVGGLAVDEFGSAYVTGWTGTTVNFPVTPGAFRTDGGGAFVVKMHPGAIGPLYGTLLGWGEGFDITVDVGGNAYIVGYTGDISFPVTPGAFDTTFNSYYSDPNGSTGYPDAFMTKLNPTGTDLVYSTFLGGDSWEWAAAVDIDAGGNAYVTGTTASSNFPTTPGSVQPGKNPVDEAFVIKLNSMGSDLVYGTHMGGSLWDGAAAVEVDALGRAHVTGATRSPDFPTTSDAYDRTYNGGIPAGDAFLAVLGPLGDQYDYSTFLGGSGSDVGIGLALDGEQAFIAGYTNSTDFPTTSNAFDRVGDMQLDAFLVKMSLASGAPQADLGVAPSDIEFDPPGPVLAGTPVTIGATVWNGGDGNAAQVRVRVLDGMPPTAPRIGPDELLTTISGFGGSATISVVWGEALPAGSHDICIVVDPNHQILEYDETNNVACLTLSVTAPPPITTLTIGAPKYTASDGTVCVTSLTSLSLIPLDQSGLGIRFTRVRFDAGPWADYAGPFTLSTEGDRLIEWHSGDNLGNVESIQSALVRLDDTPPATFLAIGDPKRIVDRTFVTSSTPIELVAFDGGAAPVGLDLLEYRIDAGVWVSYRTPFALLGEGAHIVEYRSQDFLGNAERVQSLPLFVDDTPPISTLTVGDPTSYVDGTFVTSATPLTLQAADEGVGLDAIEYRVDAGPWRTFATAVKLFDEGLHTLEFRSVDLLGNAESMSSRQVFVDNTPPTSSLNIGQPNFLVGGTFITSATPIALAAIDRGSTPSGVDAIEYQMDGGPWVLYSEPFIITAEGAHSLAFRARDRLGNTEVALAEVIVDDTPPTTEILTGVPLSAGVEMFVSSSTMFSLVATDGGPTPVGLAFIEYREDEGTWIAYHEPFLLSGPEGPRSIEFRAVDRLGNAEPASILRVVLDDSPPVTALSLESDSTLILQASDLGSGVAMMEYRVDDGDWTSYEGPVVLEEGFHLVRYRSRDLVANLEPEHVQEVRVAIQRIPLGQNYEPFVAFVFAAILVATGIASIRQTISAWNQRRRFLGVVAPFVGGEAAVGVASVFTASLSVPPIAGLALALNVSILAAGLLLLLAVGRGSQGADRPST